jgi:hypothetical protein
MNLARALAVRVVAPMVGVERSRAIVNRTLGMSVLLRARQYCAPQPAVIIRAPLIQMQQQ